MIRNDDVNFTDVNGVRFDRQRAACAFALIEAARALRDPGTRDHKEAIRQLVLALHLTPPEQAFALSVGVFRRSIDIVADAAGITWGDVMRAIALTDTTDARIEDMGLNGPR